MLKSNAAWSRRGEFHELITTVSGSAAGLTVGQLAEASHVAASAIRFYDTHGLLPSSRTPGNQRRFAEHVSCRVKMIRICQRVGLSVAEIRELLGVLPSDREAAPADWQALTDRLEAELNSRIRELKGVLDEVSSNSVLCQLPTIDDAPAGRIS